MNKLKRLLSIALGAVLSVFGALLFTAANVTAHAESSIDGADGKYEMISADNRGSESRCLKNTSIKPPWWKK